MGVAIGNKLNFDSHTASTWLKANQKLIVLSRLAQLLSFDKKRLLFKKDFKSKFIYWFQILDFA